MVWFSGEVLTSEMIFENVLNCTLLLMKGARFRGKSDVFSPEMQVIEYVYLSNIRRYCIYAKYIMNVHVRMWLIVSVFSNILCAFSIHIA